MTGDYYEWEITLDIQVSLYQVIKKHVTNDDVTRKDVWN